MEKCSIADPGAVKVVLQAREHDLTNLMGAVMQGKKEVQFHNLKPGVLKQRFDVFLKRLIYLAIYLKGSVWGRVVGRGDRSCIHWFTSQMIITAETGPGQN